MRESRLQRQCLDWVRERFGGAVLAVNIHGGGYSNKGFPDLLVMGGGRAVGVELKGDSGYKVQPDQRVWRHRFLRSGTPHHVISDFETFKNTIEEEFHEADEEVRK